MNRETGRPLHSATVFSVSEMRSRNLASATIEQGLRSILFLHTWADIEGVDLSLRYSKGEWLTLGEVDSFARAAKGHICDLKRQFDGSKSMGHKSGIAKVRRLEKFRKTSPKKPKKVGSPTTAHRILYARDYLNWLANIFMSHKNGDNDRYAKCEVPLDL